MCVLSSSLKFELNWNHFSVYVFDTVLSLGRHKRPQLIAMEAWEWERERAESVGSNYVLTKQNQ